MKLVSEGMLGLNGRTCVTIEVMKAEDKQMEKTIKGMKYYLPGNLTSEQEAIYVHIIDWKRKNIIQ